ncbi:MAG: CRISPR-associated endonuclease Cas2 [Thiothrix sp.]|uniref:CRISPR-associated endonuclease Cas2 n=1 Tax=Thiothrix sp. TaxID=1032 RepID=UPI0026281658|nr:CRISPR-associated endonuclease Cas2 [Thiothrix sp.]MDD5392727.1 CRISPR-associated endonuclease Cas2 [Thiothrix sp.]
MKRSAAVIAYDIVENSRRRQVHRCLKAWGLASQYSLFECQLGSREAEELFLQLSGLIDPQTDSLMLAWMDKQRTPRMVTAVKQNHHFQAPLWYEG